jgi:hypothetical protein
VSKLQDTGLAYLTVKGAAVRASLHLPALLVNPFAYLGSSEVVEKRAPKFPQKGAAVGFFK